MSYDSRRSTRVGKARRRALGFNRCCRNVDQRAGWRENRQRQQVRMAARCKRGSVMREGKGEVWVSRDSCVSEDFCTFDLETLAIMVVN